MRIQRVDTRDRLFRGCSSNRATNSRGAMDIFKNRYFRLSRNFMLWIGLWPYDISNGKTFRRTAVSLLFLSIGVVEVPAFNFLTMKNCDCILPWHFFYCLQRYWCSYRFVAEIRFASLQCLIILRSIINPV